MREQQLQAMNCAWDDRENRLFPKRLLAAWTPRKKSSEAKDNERDFDRPRIAGQEVDSKTLSALQ